MGWVRGVGGVFAEQEMYGSADFYRGMTEKRAGPGEDALGPREKQFLETRDSFYLATVTETDWPYVQFRGGLSGFVKVRDANTLAWADYRGNLQHITTGNLRNESRERFTTSMTQRQSWNE